MKVAFRVDSSRVMGAGHAARCLALAEAFREAGIDSEFVCRKHSGNLIPKIRAKGLVLKSFLNSIVGVAFVMIFGPF